MRRASIALLLLVALFAASGIPMSAYAEAPPNSFSDPALGFSITWPGSMERASDPGAPGAPSPVLLLRMKGQTLPTFNVLRVPGIFEAERATESIVDSYRAVGLTDAISEGGSISPQGWPIVQVAFRAGPGSDARSLVAVIQRRESHLILTFVDSKDRLSEDRPIFDALLSGVTLAAADDAFHAGVAYSTPALWVVLVVAAVLAAAATWLMYRRRSV